MNTIKTMIIVILTFLAISASAQTYVVDTADGDSLDVNELLTIKGKEAVGRDVLRMANGDTLIVLRPIENFSGHGVVNIDGKEYAVAASELRYVGGGEDLFPDLERRRFTPQGQYYSGLTPYMYVVAMVIGSLVLCLLGIRFRFIRAVALIIVPLLIAGSCYLEISAWLALKTDMFWWCDKARYGFWGSVLRVLPFAGVLVCQIVSYPLYKRLMDIADGNSHADTTIIPMAISFPAVFPVVFIVLLVCALFHMSKSMQSSIGLGISICITGIGFLTSAYFNIKAIGWIRGIIFTIFGAVYIVAAMVCLVGLGIAMWELFLQMVITMLPYVFLFVVLTHKPAANDSKSKAEERDSTLDIIMGTTKADRKREERLRKEPWLKGRI